MTDVLSPLAVAAPMGGALRPARAQAAVGLALAGMIVTAWLALHVSAVFYLPFHGAALALAPVAVAGQTWLCVGLFIIAHDCMHGSLAPFHPRLNREVGRLCLGLYAGFSYDRLLPEHHAHHRAPGTPDDPDFDPDHPRSLWRWYGVFLRHYVDARALWGIAAIVTAEIGLGAHPANVFLFFGLPAALSSLQLFYFGTYLPHRHEEVAFVDAHAARTNDFSWGVSLLTCFHFGYHHEHHLSPRIPWWRLPTERRARQVKREAH